MIRRSLHLALFAVLIGLCAAPARGAAPGTVSGIVHDSAGTPQIGAVVELLRTDLSIVATVYTNSKGAFSFGGVAPGRYAVKAMGASFLPSLRENVRVRSSAVVNLTLNTLYEVMQWLPAERRDASTAQDDWKWTLRSAANRPLLRWLEDGPLVVASDGPNKQPKLKARLVAMGKEGTFGENGERIRLEMQETPSDSRELLASVEFEPGTDGDLESMLGFRQDLGYAGAVQSVAAIAIHPEVKSGAGEGLDEAVIRSEENLNLGDEFEGEVGTSQVLARFANGSANTVMTALPFFSMGWKDGDDTISYRMATGVPSASTQSDTHAGAWIPSLSVRDGKLKLERGLHQEIGWQRKGDSASYAVALYRDRLNDPVLQASTALTGSAATFGNGALYDASSGLVRIAGAGYTSMGVIASAERRLPYGNTVRVSYANGTALTLSPVQGAQTLSEVVAAARPHRTQMYSISLSGTLEGTGTRWHASYRWQPEDTLTRVATYAAADAEPYLGVHLRQPMHRVHDGVKTVDATLDMRNALAEGAHRFVLTDGTLLVFAQDQRSISAGLAFTF